MSKNLSSEMTPDKENSSGWISANINQPKIVQISPGLILDFLIVGQAKQ